MQNLHIKIKRKKLQIFTYEDKGQIKGAIEYKVFIHDRTNAREIWNNSK